MKSPPIQIHDDIARQRVEAFIRGEDNETLKGTEEAKPRTRNGRRNAWSPRAPRRRARTAARALRAPLTRHG